MAHRLSKYNTALHLTPAKFSTACTVVLCLFFRLRTSLSSSSVTGAGDTQEGRSPRTLQHGLCNDPWCRRLPSWLQPLSEPDAYHSSAKQHGSCDRPSIPWPPALEPGGYWDTSRCKPNSPEGSVRGRRHSHRACRRTKCTC